MKNGMAIIAIAAVLMCARGWADYFEITAEELKAQGINYDLLDPINLSQDGSCFVACERITNIKRKSEGYTRTLRVIRFKDKKLDKIDTIDIPVTDWINGAVGNGKRKDEVFIIGDYGNKILKVDLNTKQIQTLLQYEKSKPGFKAGPFLLCHKGDFYATGWAYDQEQICEGDYIVKLQEDKKGQIKLTPATVGSVGVKLDSIYQEQEGYGKVYFYISGTRFLYNWIYPKEKTTRLKLYSKGEETQVIDSGYMLVIFIGTENKVFYSVIKEAKGPLRHYLVDTKNGKRQQVGKDDDPFTYPFLSDKGDVLVVVALENQYQKVTAYVGKEKDGYALKKFLHRVDPGAMKLSGDGRTFLLMHKNGLRIHYFD